MSAECTSFLALADFHSLEERNIYSYLLNEFLINRKVDVSVIGQYVENVDMMELNEVKINR